MLPLEDDAALCVVDEIEVGVLRLEPDQRVGRTGRIACHCLSCAESSEPPAPQSRNPSQASYSAGKVRNEVERHSPIEVIPIRMQGVEPDGSVHPGNAFLHASTEDKE